MRSYVGERSAAGPPTVTVEDAAAGPPVSEIGDLLADLRSLTDPVRGAERWPAEREAWMARKRDLLARIEASETPPRRPLARISARGADDFDWGDGGGGATNLAHALLHDHLGAEPTAAVRTAFRDDVIAELPEEGFRLPARVVGAWVAANRELIDRELFLSPIEADPSRDDEVARSVRDDDSPPPVVGIDDPAVASTLIAACESAWTDIQSHHPDLPDAVMVLGTGVERGRLVKLGHWWGGQWLADGQSRGEVLLAGEALHLEPKQVFEVLLHEAAHGINAARGVKDTSRGGRYHNQKYAQTAKEVLLQVRAMPPYGLAATELSTAATERYADTIDRLGDAMRIVRQLGRGIQVGAEGSDGLEGSLGGGKSGADGGRSQGANAPATCGCGRKMRMAPSTLAAGPVVCGLCDTKFTTGAQRAPNPEAEHSDDLDTSKPGAAAAVVDRTFLSRRQASIEAEISHRQPTDATVTRILERRRAQVDGLVAVAPDGAGGPLLERHDRLTRLLQAGIASTLGTDAANTSEDHSVLASWYERFGTLDEQPMPATSAAEAARRQQQARTLLQAEGLLHGPEAATGDGRLFQAGDRVAPTADQAQLDLPAGTPGTIEAVDPLARTLDVDFATWGRLRAHLDDAITASLRHDYTEVRGPKVPELDLGIDP